MELVKVEITGQAITARYGTLNTGDILRTDAAFAKHLVEDCSAAKYCAAVEKDPENETPVTRKKREKPVPPAASPINPVETDAQAPASLALDAASDANQTDEVAAGENKQENGLCLN